MTELPLETILHLIRARTGWELRDEDGARLREKLLGRLTAVRETPATYVQRLETEPQGAEWSELLALLSNPETYFFRDSRQIALLKDRILPELLERRRPHRSLRIWSAGCSTGEEAYSLAFLLQELAPDLASWEVLILGTDVNPQVIEKAREGRYREWSFRGRHAKLDRYFNREGDTWRVKDHLRRLATFRLGNLVDDQFPDARSEIREMDLIVCRNVFIYFSRPAVAKVVAKMAATLRQGGFLVTGHTELHGVPLPQLPLQPRRFGDSLA
ncbi:MAG: CheR family methyltransferase, partial [Actinomycetota bacterium]